MTTATMSVMERLKAETTEHHARAEGKALQQSMVRGTLTREKYAAFLGQMYLVHRGLEAAVDRSRGSCEALKVVTDEQTHSRRLADDLRYYGVDAASVKPIASTTRLLSRIDALAREHAFAALGLHYVLEGSMNGNKYIAMALRKSLGLAGPDGQKYLDPYGDQQRAKWAAWKAGVDACAISTAEADAAVEAAKAMFDGIAEISEEVAT